MQNTAPYFTPRKPTSSSIYATISVAELTRHAQDWLYDGEYRNHSPRTIEAKRDVVKKLLWFLEHRQYSTCGTPELRQFLAYITTGHLEPGGRWGNPHMTRAVTPRTVASYYVYLQGLFRWLVAEEAIEASPLERIAKPVLRSQPVQGFTPEQLQALMAAARRSVHPRRDEAIVLFLLDTVVRVSELCALRLCDLDLTARQCQVMGKGGKRRNVYLGRTCSKALYTYLREYLRAPDEPVFLSERGGRSGERLTRSGVFQLIERLGREAKIQLTKCSRIFFATLFAFRFCATAATSSPCSKF